MEQQPVWAWGFGRRRQDGTQFPHVQIEDTMVGFFFFYQAGKPTPKRNSVETEFQVPMRCAGGDAQVVGHLQT